jgi:hypothetical protein
MAVQAVTLYASQVEKERLGYIGISLTEWTTTNEPTIASGSKLECAGTLYEFTADTDIDPDNNWAGIANSTVVYCKFDPVNLKSILTITAPTWDTAKQGYYGAAGSANHRYYGRVYKDSGGLYTQKAIYLNESQLITNAGIYLPTGVNADTYQYFATDAYIFWDESKSLFSMDKLGYKTNERGADTLLLNVVGAGATLFTILKPISCYLELSGSPGDTASLYIYQLGSDRQIGSTLTPGAGGTVFGLQLNPGNYRVNTSASANFSLYCSGVFSKLDMTISDIISIP